jgi:hypothetical protein
MEHMARPMRTQFVRLCVTALLVFAAVVAFGIVLGAVEELGSDDPVGWGAILVVSMVFATIGLITFVLIAFFAGRSERRDERAVATRTAAVRGADVIVLTSMTDGEWRRLKRRLVGRERLKAVLWIPFLPVVVWQVVIDSSLGSSDWDLVQHLPAPLGVVPGLFLGFGVVLVALLAAVHAWHMARAQLFVVKGAVVGTGEMRGPGVMALGIDQATVVVRVEGCWHLADRGRLHGSARFAGEQQFPSKQARVDSAIVGDTLVGVCRGDGRLLRRLQERRPHPPLSIPT